MDSHQTDVKIVTIQIMDTNIGAYSGIQPDTDQEIKITILHEFSPFSDIWNLLIEKSHQKIYQLKDIKNIQWKFSRAICRARASALR